MLRFALKQRLVVVGPLVLLLLLTGFLPPAHRALAAGTVTIDPLSGLPGATVHATGSGWVPGDHIEVRWETHDLLIQTIVNNGGSFDFYFTVPFEAISGSRTIYFNDVTNGFSLPQSFSVESPDSVWLGNSQGGDLVWMVIKGSYITTIQFKSTDGSVKTCFNVLITNYQFSCTTNGGSTAIEGHYASLSQVVGTYISYGQQVQWTAAIFTQSISSIRGQITDSTNAPIAGVTVSAAGPTPTVTTTDIQGNYVLDGLADGNYIIALSKSGYTFNPSSLSTAVPPDATGKNFIGTATTQPTVDLSIDSVSPVQVLEGQDLIKNKATAVKVVVHKTGNAAISNVSVRLELSSMAFASKRFYVAESSNIDAASNYELIADNSIHPLNFSEYDDSKVIYFFGSELAPIESTYKVNAIVDDSNAILETNENNNTTPSGNMQVYDTNWSDFSNPPGLWSRNLTIHYFRADWGDWGVIGSNTFNSFYQASNDFLSAVYPVAKQRFTPEKSSEIYDSTSFRGQDGRMDGEGFKRFARDSIKRMRIAYRTADRFVMTVPSGWFHATTPYTTDAGINPHPPYNIESWPILIDELTIVEARPFGPMSTAHELGHSYGLPLNGCAEEYDTGCATDITGVGNYAASGIWVDKKIPIQIAAHHDVYCFMSNAVDKSYWIDLNDYKHLFNSHQSPLTQQTIMDTSSSQSILVSGIFNDNNSVTLDNWYVLDSSELSSFTSGAYAFVYQDANNTIIYQRSFDVPSNIQSKQPFVYTIPYVPGTAKIAIKHNNVSLAEKTLSRNAPNVTVLSPNGGEEISGKTIIHWSGNDADGDALSYAILYSADNGVTWETLAMDVTSNNYAWNLTRNQPGTHYMIKLIATDGINTGSDVTDGSFSVRKGIYLPIVARK